MKRYLDPQNIPKTPSQEVFGSLGKQQKTTKGDGAMDVTLTDPATLMDAAIHAGGYTDIPSDSKLG